jgi:hexosaminidase
MFLVPRFSSLLVVLLFSGSLFAGPIHIIPEPVSVKEQPGHFALTSATAISPAVDSFGPAAAWLGDHLRLQQGKGGKRITLATPADRNTLGTEGYTLSVTPSGIRITANTAAGIFYGMQSLLQLLPPDAAPGQAVDVPCVEITDYPRFGWRGLMLDVSRHFFTKAEVERYIDDMVRYKFNTLHLHLSDDQGWRIEIKSLPQLTQHGAWRVSRTGRWGEYLPPLANEPTPYGGFYTQDDMREIIKYAAGRHVTILPEIDIPAHSLALISSYPNLSCTQLQYSVNPGARPPIREDNALCIGNDSVYMMLDKIITEVAALFPNPYIHIGGDEAFKGFWAACPKCTKRMQDENLKNVDELQSYFVKRIEKIVNSKGKKLIGWDEILEGGLAPTATVMSWRGMSGGVAAAKMGHPVVMTPWDYVYIDLYQGEPSVEPPTYGICRLKDSYTWDPVPDSVDEKLILGGQGNLWSESVPTYRHAQYMTWPRGLALAEVYWSPKSARNWDDFTQRMEAEFKRMDAAGIKYARSAFNPILVPKRQQGGDITITLTSEVSGLDIYYSFDQTNPDPTYPKYTGTPLKFPMGAGQINVVTYRDGKPIGMQVGVKKEDLIKRAAEAHHVY